MTILGPRFSRDHSPHAGMIDVVGGFNIVTTRPADRCEDFARALYGMNRQYLTEAAVNVSVSPVPTVRVTQG